MQSSRTNHSFPEAHDCEIYSASFHPFCSELLVTGGYDGSMSFWMLTDEPPKRQTHVPAAHEGSIWDLDWHPLGHMLVSSSNDHTSKFWSRSKPGDSARDLYRGTWLTTGSF